MVEWIFVKFDVVVMPLEAIPNSSLFISNSIKYQREVCWNLWVGRLILRNYAITHDPQQWLMTSSPAKTSSVSVTWEGLDGFSWSFVWTLLSWKPCQFPNFKFPTVSNTNATDVQTCKVTSWLGYYSYLGNFVALVSMVAIFTLVVVLTILSFNTVVIRSLLEVHGKNVL